MKRTVLGVTLILAIAGAALLSLPATARVAPGADLQLTVGGDHGIAAAPLKCKRQRDRCPISNASGCADC
ncbi:MAG: hypothetical protein ACRD5D_11170 [Candidatus Polarisedimenticolia bacterium]